jgi:hypothetical protein
MSLLQPRLFTSLVLFEPVMDVCKNLFRGPGLGRTSTMQQDLWSSGDEAIDSAKRSHKSWDKRVLQCWSKHGYRAQPTVLNSQSKLLVPTLETGTFDSDISWDLDRWVQVRWPNNGFRQLATDDKPKEGTEILDTTKHKKEISYLRPNFGGTTPTPSSVSEIIRSTAKTAVARTAPAQVREYIDRTEFADVMGLSGTTTPSYQVKPTIAHLELTNVHSSVLYVYGERSCLSSPKLHNAKSDGNSGRIGGIGGAVVGRVKEVILPNSGHFVPMEDVNGCAEAASSWLGMAVERWKTGEAKASTSWEGKSSKERVAVKPERVEKLRSRLQFMPYT